LHQIIVTGPSRDGEDLKRNYMSKATARILLIILILALAALACVRGGGGDGGVAKDGSLSVNNNTPQDMWSADATATYGAEQFHIQLTAIAQPDP
jgi:hypothetical protein